MPDFPILSPTPPSPIHPGRPVAGANTGARTLTRATSDIEAVGGWLNKYTDNRNTFDAYRREAERLLAWASFQGKALADLMAEDLTAYGAFLRNPQPIEDWCLVKVPRFLESGEENPEWHTVQRPPRVLANGEHNPDWRPFVGALSPSAAGQALTILFGMFEYLCGIGYLAGNPLRASRKRGHKPRKRTMERYLEEDLWQFVMAHLERWPKDTPRLLAIYHRTKFIARFLHLTGLRRFELAQASTADLQRMDGAYWLKVMGKGAVEDSVPLTRASMETLAEYRESTGRPPLPDPSKPEPLLMDIAGTGRFVSGKTIHAVLQTLFKSALAECTDPYHAEKLKAASTHWLRHTSATHLLNSGLDLLQTRDLLRHASTQTTEIYLHTDSAKLHADLEKIQQPNPVE